MNIQVLASGSSGNCIRVSDGTSSLLLDAGIPYRKIQQGLDFKMSEIEAVLLSSEHGDHSKAIPDLLKYGIDVWTSEGTAKALNITGHRLYVIRSLQQFSIGNWLVMPFDVTHDTAEPLSYLICNGLEKILWIAETEYVKYKFRGITTILCEANYSLDLIRQSVKEEAIAPELKNRVMRNHLSIENLVEFIKANDMSKLQEVYLLHLSMGNSDAEAFKKTISGLTGKPTYIC
jgi:phosphoribosyl 1,2-cyclic phosphodiesterase